MVDAIITPSKVVRLERKYFQPKGIIWEKITRGQLEGMPLLYELQRVLNKKFSRRKEQSYADVETSTILPRDDVDGQAQRDT